MFTHNLILQTTTTSDIAGAITVPTVASPALYAEAIAEDQCLGVTTDEEIFFGRNQP
jgi:hypothetical protein